MTATIAAMHMSAQQFRDWEHKAITVLGMSGVGKTTLSNHLPQSSWFRYSGDYRIGTRYLDEPIMDNIKQQAMQVGFLRDLLRSDSIYIANNITIHNLEIGKTTFIEQAAWRAERNCQYQALQLLTKDE